MAELFGSLQFSIIYLIISLEQIFNSLSHIEQARDLFSYATFPVLRPHQAIHHLKRNIFELRARQIKDKRDFKMLLHVERFNYRIFYLINKPISFLFYSDNVFVSSLLQEPQYRKYMEIKYYCIT